MALRTARDLTAIALTVLVGSAPAAVANALSASAHPPRGPTASASASSRPDKADWEKIKTAAHLRTMALAPHRTARFRAFAAMLGLQQLVSLRPLAPGRCATAVRYLYNNLLDLQDAYPGEDWNPLRRLVAKEPSINACAPRPPTRGHA